MDQHLTAILPCNDLEQAQAFFERLGFSRDEGPDDYRMLSDGLGGYIHLTPAVEGWLTPGRNPCGLYLYRKDVDGLAAAFKSETLEQGWAKRQAVGNVRVRSQRTRRHPCKGGLAHPPPRLRWFRVDGGASGIVRKSAAAGGTCPFRGAGGKVGNQRVSPIAPNPREGLLIEPIPAVRFWSRERLFMPLLRHSFDVWNDRDEAASGRRLEAPLVVTLRRLSRCPPVSRRIIRLPLFAFRAYYAPKASAGTTTMDIAGWLRGLGLERYEQAFRDNEIDQRILPELTADDLKELGVTAIGHRRLLLRAIADLAVGADHAVAHNAPPVLPSAPTVEAERRQLTVMFCDLVGSTPLSARFDPEDLRGIIGSYHRCVAEMVESFGGFVARYMGDGALIYFGYPRAHEDDAERAIRCGLALVDRVSQLNLAEELHARLGIATGLVVVGGEVVEHDVVGETPNLAARLQALAEPDTVVIAAGTRQLVGDLFEYRDLDAVELKGIARPVPAWQVLRPSAVASRFEALHGGALSTLIGRDEELELLLRRWARAKAGDGQVVLVSGEPGIGKSRLAAALAERLIAERHVRLRYFCSPYHQARPDRAIQVRCGRPGRGLSRRPDPR